MDIVGRFVLSSAHSMNENVQAAPPAEGGKAELPRRRNRWALPLVIAALTLLTLRVPQEVLNGFLDDSWNAVLVYAHVNGFKFADGMVFPYGPLGYLAINHFVPDTAMSRLLMGLLTTALTIIGLCLLAWRMKWPWRVAWLIVFALFCGVLHWAGDDLFVELSLFAWGLLCLLESGRRLKWALACLLVTALLAALIKVSVAILACLALGTVACDLVLRKRALLAAGTVGIFCVAWAVSWLLLGQSLATAPVFFHHWLQTASAYNQAMSLDGGSVASGLLMVAAAVSACLLRVTTMDWPDDGRFKLRKKLLLAWLAAQIFLAWKYGYVRSDQVHLALFLVLLPVISWWLEALPASPPRLQWAGRAAASVCAAVTFCALFGMSHSFPAKIVEWSAENMKDNLRAVFQPDVYVQEKVEQQKVQVAKMQLPAASKVIDRGTVDVFGQYPILAILNGWNYHPRPVIQSYSACGPALMELDERFFLSTNAPEFVLFDLDAIDGRFPAVEDALALRAVLCNYRLVTNDNVYLVLRHVRNEAAKLKLVREGDVAWSGRIGLTNTTATNLWLELDARPSLAGRARQFLYKTPEVTMSVWSGTNAEAKTFRVPVSMLRAGFVASPVLLSPSDVRKLYEGQDLEHATGLALDYGPAGAGPWQPQIHYRLYAIENLLAAHGN
jgi:hypothetical protein